VKKLLRTCLESEKISYRDDRYDFDQLASILAQEEPERAFILLRHLLSHPKGRGWNPLRNYNPNWFWNTLRDIDKESAYQALVDAALNDEMLAYNMARGQFGDIRFVEDADALIDIARKSPKHAAMVCELLSNRDPGFWRIAAPILETYVDNSEVLEALTKAIHQIGGSISASMPAEIEIRSQLVDEVLNNPAISHVARSWLTKQAKALREEAERAKQMWQNELPAYVE